MPPRSKIERLPDALKHWLAAELAARGYADCDGVTEALNARLEAEGLDLVVSRSALGRYNKTQKRYVEIQRRSDEWAGKFLADEGIDAEAKRHRALFSMLSTHAFQVMEMGFRADDDKEDLDFDPRDLHLMGRMLKDMMASSGLREAISDKERARIAAEERIAAGTRAEEAATRAGLSPETSARLRAEVEGEATT